MNVRGFIRRRINGAKKLTKSSTPSYRYIVKISNNGKIRVTKNDGSRVAEMSNVDDKINAELVDNSQYSSLDHSHLRKVRPAIYNMTKTSRIFKKGILTANTLLAKPVKFVASKSAKFAYGVGKKLTDATLGTTLGVLNNLTTGATGYKPGLRRGANRLVSGIESGASRLSGVANKATSSVTSKYLNTGSFAGRKLGGTRKNVLHKKH